MRDRPLEVLFSSTDITYITVMGNRVGDMLRDPASCGQLEGTGFTQIQPFIPPHVEAFHIDVQLEEPHSMPFEYRPIRQLFRWPER